MRKQIDKEYKSKMYSGVFNKKLDRAYNQYTVETRQNLERGTAL